MPSVLDEVDIFGTSRRAPKNQVQMPSPAVVLSPPFLQFKVAMKCRLHQCVIRVKDFIKKYVASLCCGVFAAAPLASLASPLGLQDIEQALRCNDLAKWTQVMRDQGP